MLGFLRLKEIGVLWLYLPVAPLPHPLLDRESITFSSPIDVVQQDLS
jgi:hypothetical protein